MRGADPKGIGDILAELKESTELGKKFKEAQIWERWPEVAGPKLMAFGRPIGIRDETLFIEVSSAVWMHKFSYYKSEILTRVNELLGENPVTDLYFNLAPEEKAGKPQDTV